MKFVERKYPGKHCRYLKALSKRTVHATDGGRNSDSDSEDDRRRIHREHGYAGGRDFNMPQDFMEIMKKQIAAMLNSINVGGNGRLGSRRAGPLEQPKMSTWKEGQLQ